MVSMLAFYSVNPSSNPADVYSFSVSNLCWKRTKINKKSPGCAHFKKKQNKCILSLNRFCGDEISKRHKKIFYPTQSRLFFSQKDGNQLVASLPPS